MQLQHLRYFVAVADLGHFTRAAERIGVSQPTLSKQVSALEAGLGTPLFDRAPGAVRLTQAGETLLPLARRMIADAETAHRAVQEVAGLRRGRVRLGATPSLCTSLAAEVLRRYTRRYPGIEVHVVEGGSRDLVADLVAGGLDLALIVLPTEGVDPALRTEPVLHDELVVASARSGPAPASADRMSVAELRDRPLVMFRPGYDLREATLQACRRAGFAPRLAVQGGEMDAVLSFVEAGLGLALLPSLALVNRPRVRATGLAEPELRRTIAVARHGRSLLPHAARALRATVLAYLAEAARSGDLPTGVSFIARPAPAG